MAKTTRLTDIGLPQQILTGASAYFAVTSIHDRASSIWSFQRMQGRPLRRLSLITASNTRLSGASSSIRTTWPSQRSRWILIRSTTSHIAHYWIECGNHRQLALDLRSYVGLFSRILSRLVHQCFIMSTSLRHKEARVRWGSCRVLVLSCSIAHWDHNSTCWQEFDLQTDIIFGSNDGAKIFIFNYRKNAANIDTCSGLPLASDIIFDQPKCSWNVHRPRKCRLYIKQHKSK